jgi:peptidoglycan-associated lipoprotein
MQPIQLAVLVITLVLLSGCETTGKKGPPSEGVEPTGETTGEAPGRATARGVDEPSRFQGHPLDDPESLLAKRVIYFDLDSVVLSEEDYDTVIAHAAYLAENPSASVTLEGHADERGSREYNLALGERRANAVREVVMLHGATSSQVEVVSYGEERPVALGHDESAWQLNRRVEIIYTRR